MPPFGPNGGASHVDFLDNSVATFRSPTDTGTVVIASDFNSVSASAQVVVAAGTLRDGNGTLGNALSSAAMPLIAANMLLPGLARGLVLLGGSGTAAGIYETAGAIGVLKAALVGLTKIAGLGAIVAAVPSARKWCGRGEWAQRRACVVIQDCRQGPAA